IGAMLITGMKPEAQADSDEELLGLVEKILGSGEVVSIAQSLIALSNDASGPSNYIEHLKGLPTEEQESAIEAKIGETSHEILGADVFAEAIAVTNAVGWGIDEFEIQEVALSDAECTIKLSFSASGDQLQDKTYMGDQVTGT